MVRLPGNAGDDGASRATHGLGRPWIACLCLAALTCCAAASSFDSPVGHILPISDAGTDASSPDSGNVEDAGQCLLAQSASLVVDGTLLSNRTTLAFLPVLADGGFFETWFRARIESACNPRSVTASTDSAYLRASIDDPQPGAIQPIFVAGRLLLGPTLPGTRIAARLTLSALNSMHWDMSFRTLSNCPATGTDAGCRALRVGDLGIVRGGAVQVDTPSGVLSGPSILTDANATHSAREIAIDSSGRLWGVDLSGAVCVLDVESGTARFCTRPLVPGGIVAMSGLSDGGLLVAGSGLFEVDPEAGTVLREILPPGSFLIAGDVAALGGNAYLVTQGLNSTEIERVSLADGGRTTLVALGSYQLPGLAVAASRDSLVGFTSNQRRVVLSLDAGVVLSDVFTGQVVSGAATFPE